MVNDLPAAVQTFCEAEGLFQPGQTVACAVSGGADSMALLWCLRDLAWNLDLNVTAAHFNHHLRGAESDRDEAFVRDFCAEHGIELAVGHGDVAAHAKLTGQGIEEAARNLRYTFLQSLDADLIATAHHADDNAETILMNLLRGTGLRGLCGIRPKRGRVVRPLLAVTRNDIVNYLRLEGVDWVEDSTNAEDSSVRNVLRHHVMPRLNKLSPWFTGKLPDQTAILRAEDAWLDEQAAGVLAAACLPEGGLRCSTLAAAPKALQGRVLRLWLRDDLPQGLGLSHIRELLELLDGEPYAASADLPRGLRVIRQYDELTLRRAPLPAAFRPAVLTPAESMANLPDLGLKITCTRVEKYEKIPNSPFHFAIRCDMIQQDGIVIRPRRTGDSIATPGGHHTTLKKLFIDRHIPRDQRDRMAVLVSGEQVLGVAGIGANPDVLPEAGSPALIILIEKEEK